MPADVFLYDGVFHAAAMLRCLRLPAAALTFTFR